jgi:hypothetical protein
MKLDKKGVGMAKKNSSSLMYSPSKNKTHKGRFKKYAGIFFSKFVAQSANIIHSKENLLDLNLDDLNKGFEDCSEQQKYLLRLKEQ